MRSGLFCLLATALAVGCETGTSGGSSSGGTLASGATGSTSSTGGSSLGQRLGLGDRIGVGERGHDAKPLDRRYLGGNGRSDQQRIRRSSGRGRSGGDGPV